MPNYDKMSTVARRSPEMSLRDLKDLQRLKDAQKAQQAQRLAGELLRSGARGRTPAPMSLLDLVMKHAKPAAASGLMGMLYSEDLGDATLRPEDIVQSLPFRGYDEDERRQLPYNGDIGGIMQLLR